MWRPDPSRWMERAARAGAAMEQPMIVIRNLMVSLRIGAVVAVPLVAFALSTLSSAPRGLVPQQPLIEGVGDGAAANASDINLHAWVDRSDATYRPGDALTLKVQADKDAYLTVLDVGTSGKVQVLLPNKYQRDNRIQAHETVQIPDERSHTRLTVHGPAGSEMLKVLATDKPVIDVSRLHEAGDYYAMAGDTENIARDLSVDLNAQGGNGLGVATRVVRIVTGTGNPSALPVR